MADFTQGYVEAMFASLAAPARSCGWCGEAVSTAVTKRTCRRHRQCTSAVRIERARLWPRKSPGFSDLSRSAHAMILKDCALFADYMAQVAEGPLNADGGRHYWNQRQSGWPAYPLMRAELAKTFPPRTVTVGDDGKVRLA